MCVKVVVQTGQTGQITNGRSDEMAPVSESEAVGGQYMACLDRPALISKHIQSETTFL